MTTAIRVAFLLAPILLTGCAVTGPSDLVRLHQQAQSAYAEGRAAEAESHYRQLTERLPTDAEPWFRLGNLYARSQRFDAARHAYREALVRQPNQPKAWHNLGVTHLHQALEALSEAVARAPLGSPLHSRSQSLLEALARLPVEESSGETKGGEGGLSQEKQP